MVYGEVTLWNDVQIGKKSGMYELFALIVAIMIHISAKKANRIPGFAA